VIGLIGGIGSGKSQVAAELARRGATIIEGDQLGHEALRQPEIRKQLEARWGPDIIQSQGAIDRRKVGAIVFANPEERRFLESVVFPYIESRIAAELALARQAAAVPLIVLDAAILLETGWGRHCDWIVYVHAPREQRVRRITQQRGWTEKEMQQRSGAQLSLTDKVSRADFVLDNSGTLDDLVRQIDQLLQAPELRPCFVTRQANTQ
jgi:dephospho-CoA kinase